MIGNILEKKYDWSSNEMIICRRFVSEGKKKQVFNFSNHKTGSKNIIYYPSLIQFRSYWISVYQNRMKKHLHVTN